MTRKSIFFFVVLAMLAALMVVLTIPASAGPGEDHKITICHVPPGNPANAHEITVDKSAWENGHSPHNAHSLDYVGGCEKEEPTDVPPTRIPPTNVPPTRVPPTRVPPTTTPPPQPSATPLPPTSTETPELVPSVVYCEAVPTATATILPESADGCYIEQVAYCCPGQPQALQAETQGLSSLDALGLSLALVGLVSFVAGVTFMAIMQIAANLGRRR